MNMHRDDLVSVIVARDANGKRHAGWKSSRLAAFDACIVRDELVDELSSRLGLTFALGPQRGFRKFPHREVGFARIFGIGSEKFATRVWFSRYVITKQLKIAWSIT